MHFPIQIDEYISNYHPSIPSKSSPLNLDIILV